MKLRSGSHGSDMWPICHKRGIAAITYTPIINTDLSSLTKGDVDEGVKTAARASIRRFAWEIRGGDIIYVGDSVSRKMIARGRVRAGRGERAYRFNKKNPISDLHVFWRHEVPVTWDSTFVPFVYKDKAPRYTVTPLELAWAYAAEGQLTEIPPESLNQQEAAYLDDSAYVREAQYLRKEIKRRHATLSNSFRKWLKKRYGVSALQESERTDLKFSHAGIAYLAELKICHSNNTRQAIREALGQILEYNHYPPRTAAQSWWIVLDNRPKDNDLNFIETIRDAYHLPLGISWEADGGFESNPASLLTNASRPSRVRNSSHPSA